MVRVSIAVQIVGLADGIRSELGVHQRLHGDVVGSLDERGYIRRVVRVADTLFLDFDAFQRLGLSPFRRDPAVAKRLCLPEFNLDGGGGVVTAPLPNGKDNRAEPNRNIRDFFCIIKGR
jgi:hypothetical protein